MLHLSNFIDCFPQPRSAKHLFENGEHWNPKSNDDYMSFLTTCEK